MVPMQQAGQEMAACLMLLLGHHNHTADIAEISAVAISAVAISAVVLPYLVGDTGKNLCYPQSPIF